jgi:hypothetical protein
MVDDAHPRPRLVLIFILKIQQTVVQRLCRLPIQNRLNLVQTSQQPACLTEKVHCCAGCFILGRHRSFRQPDGKCGQPFWPFKPFFKTVNRVRFTLPLASISSTIFNNFSGVFVGISCWAICGRIHRAATRCFFSHSI